MEVDGVIEMFQRSESLHAAKYVNSIGNGDSKTFKNLLDAQIYNDTTISKLECVLHVGKHMFRRLTDAKKNIIMEENLSRENEKCKEKKSKTENSKKEIKKSKTENFSKKGVKRLGKNKPTAKKVIEKSTKLTGKIMKELSAYYSLAI